VRHVLSAVEPTSFFGSPCLMIAAILEVGFSVLWQVVAPCDFERRARTLGTHRHSMSVLAQVTARIKAAGPLPPIFCRCRNTRSLGNRINANASMHNGYASFPDDH
jgi:hypothetical protein